MAKHNAAPVPSMRGYKSDRRPKGVQYVQGDQKNDLLRRVQRAFLKAKIKLHA